MTDSPVATTGKPAGNDHGARAAPAAHLRHSPGRFWLGVLFWWTQHSPRVVLWTRRFWVRSAWLFSRFLREGTLSNARRILGPQASRAACKALAQAMIRSFYTSVYELGDCVRQSPDELRDRIDGVQGHDAYAEARKRGHGAIIVTAHLGSFELGAIALTQREKRVHVVFQRDAHERFDRLRTELRRRIGVTEAPVDEGWSIWVRLRDALLADEVVMIQADRVMPGQRGAPVRFFGGHIRVPTGPVKLALATGAPLIPVFSLRTAVGKVRIVIDKPIYLSQRTASHGDQPPGSTADSAPNDLSTALQAVAEAVERQVRAHPEQWLMVEPVWCEDLGTPTTPSSGPSA